MITQRRIIDAVALSCLIVFPAQAQRGTPPTGREGAAPAAAGNEMKVNLEGCIFPKRALSSKEPVTVSADSAEDYVVTDTHVISVSPSLSAPEGRVYKMNGVEQADLRRLLGKRVGVSARVDDTLSVPELQVISIRETVGLCPVVPKPQP